jgi:hypothetical protein
MNSASPGDGRGPYEPLDMPRRDRVPPSGFSRPSDVNADPELTSFIPPFRAKRRRIARRLTLIIVAAVGFMGLRLAMWTARVGVTDERPLGIFAYFFLLACMIAGFFGIRKIWRWADAPDPADVRNPIMRGVPPLV